MIPAPQAETAAFLARLSGASPVETHISAVYVGRDTAWKMKKAVALGFLDFTRLEDREHFCRRELDAEPPPRAGHLPRRGADHPRRRMARCARVAMGPVVEWVLRMAPIAGGGFPRPDHAGRARCLMPWPMRWRRCTPRPSAPRSTRPPSWPASSRAICPPRLHAGLPANRVEGWAVSARQGSGAARAGAGRRGAEGFVRRCHGDLHLGNLCLWEGRPTPFDALEFDEALARIDVGYDLAFLLMDLDLRHGRAAANRVLNRYVARTGDAGIVAGLPFWLSMRAMIRAHVEAARGA